jgi:hypothetical protein
LSDQAGFAHEEVSMSPQTTPAELPVGHLGFGAKQTGEAAKRFRPQLKPGTRLMREWQGRTYEVVVLDDGFCWQGTRCNSLSAIARKITGTAWSGPLFFGLKRTRSASRRSSHALVPVCGPMESSDAAE